MPTKAMSAIEQSHYPINDVIIFLSYDWSSGQPDDAITN